MDRRTFIRSAAGLFVAAAAAPIVEPVERVRRWWQVGRNAPVSERRAYVWDDCAATAHVGLGGVSDPTAWFLQDAIEEALRNRELSPAGSAALHMTSAALHMTVREPWTPVSGAQAHAVYVPSFAAYEIKVRV